MKKYRTVIARVAVSSFVCHLLPVIVVFAFCFVVFNSNLRSRLVFLIVLASMGLHSFPRPRDLELAAFFTAPSQICSLTRRRRCPTQNSPISARNVTFSRGMFFSQTEISSPIWMLPPKSADVSKEQ